MVIQDYKHQAFISYAHSDEAIARRIHNASPNGIKLLEYSENSILQRCNLDTPLEHFSMFISLQIMLVMLGKQLTSLIIESPKRPQDAIAYI